MVKIRKECIRGFVSELKETNFKEKELREKWLELIKVSNEIIALRGEDILERMFAAMLKQIRTEALNPNYNLVDFMDIADEILKAFGGAEPSWWDHFYVLPGSIVLEPYGTYLEEMETLIGICKKLDLNFEINPKSTIHFPGRTLPIRIFRLDE